MIPQSRIPTTPHHPLAPILPNAFLYPSFLLLLLTRKNPGNLSRPRNSSRLPGLILSSVYPLKPAKFLFLSCTARIFPKAPSFSPPSSEHPLSVFSPKTDTAFRPRPCARTGAEPLAVPHGSSFFRSPHPPDRRRTVNGPFFASQVSVCSLFTPALRLNAAPFVPFLRAKRPGFPDRTLQPAKAPHPFLTAWKPFHSSPKSQLFLFSPAKLRKT